MFAEVCISTLAAIVFAVIGLVALALFIGSRLSKRHEGRKEEPLSRADWFSLVGLLIAVAGFFVGFVVIECPEPEPEPPPNVGISLADSRLNPADYDDPSEEYVCLISGDDRPVSLAGWELQAAKRQINVLPNFTLKPGAAVRVHPGEGMNSDGDLYGEEGSPSWLNDGGQITLLDDEGQEIDSVGYSKRKDVDGTGKCGPGAELALRVTSPDRESVVSSATITIRGTVSSGSVVRAKIDHDDESDSGGKQARVISGDGVDHFAVELRLDQGENSIRVQAERPGGESVVEFLGVTREDTTPPPPPTCDPNYKGACLDPNAVDYDCEGGEGNGPEYVEGPVRIVGEDRFDLDRNGDGVACEP